MAPEDPFAGINPERLAMMQSVNAPPAERRGRGGRDGRGSDRGGRMRNRYAYRNSGRTQGSKTTFNDNGLQNGNGAIETSGETSALQRRDAKKNGGKPEVAVQGAEIDLAQEKSEQKKKRKRSDEMEVSVDGDKVRSKKDKKRKKSRSQEVSVNDEVDENEKESRKHKKSRSQEVSVNGEVDENEKESRKHKKEVVANSAESLDEQKSSKEEKKAVKAAKKAAKETKKTAKAQKELNRVRKRDHEEVSEPEKIRSKSKSSKKGGSTKSKTCRPKDEKPDRANGRNSDKNEKARMSETAESSIWNASQLSGGDERKAKFLRLLGADHAPLSVVNGSGKTHAISISKRELELEKQFDTGMRMKNEAGGRKRGLGAL